MHIRILEDQVFPDFEEIRTLWAGGNREEL